MICIVSVEAYLNMLKFTENNLYRTIEYDIIFIEYHHVTILHVNNETII